MPELPEVETIRNQIEKELLGEVISEVRVLDEMCFEGSVEDFRGEKLVGVSRIGKWLFLHFESGKGAEIHLKMTGRLTVDESYENKKHTRIIIEFESGVRGYYWDTRKFGYVKSLVDVESAKFQLSARLGPDPWEISVEELTKKLGKTGRKIKDVLLDQGVLAGVGNIYANDALWLAGIAPKRKADSLSNEEVEKLLSAVRSVMEKGLETGGASDNTYRDLYGEKGSYQEEFLVYGKTGGKCVKCGGELKYEKVSGRGTWWCEECQK